MWKFAFEPRTAGDLGGMAGIRGREIVYLRELAPQERVCAILDGYEPSAKHHRFTLENRKTGLGVRISGDRPITKLIFWSRRLAYCPKAYVTLRILPGKAETWENRFEFFTGK